MKRALSISLSGLVALSLSVAQETGGATGGVTGGEVEIGGSLAGEGGMTGGDRGAAENITGGAGSATGGSMSASSTENLDELMSSYLELGWLIERLEASETGETGGAAGAEVEDATLSELRRIYDDLGSTVDALQALDGTGGSETGGGN